MSSCISPSFFTHPTSRQTGVGPFYQIFHVLICLPLAVPVTYSHYRHPFQFTQTNGFTSWATSAGRLDSRSIVMVSSLTEIYWGRSEITWNLTIFKISLWAAVSVKENTQGFSWLPFPLLREHCLRKRFPTSTVTSGDKASYARFTLLLCDTETTFASLRNFFFSPKITRNVTSSYFPVVSWR